MPGRSTNNSQDSVVMVVQSLPPLPSGGAEIQALRLAEILMRKGIRVMFITPGTATVKGSSEINGVPVYRLRSVLNYLLDLLFFVQKKSPAPKTTIEFDDTKLPHNVISRKIGIGARLRYRIFLFNATRFLKKRKNEFSVVHSHTIEWPGYVATVLANRLNKKLIVKDSTMNGIFNILRFPSGAEKQQLIIRSAHFVAMTTVIYNNLITAGVRAENITKIPNGIHIEGEYKKDYEGTAKVLFVGNLYQQPAKGIDILLKAWASVIKEVPGATLQLAGDGDLVAYRNYVAGLNINSSVEFLGKRDDVPSLMIASDVFVLPSRREGMPNVLMEAMLRAVPCVATAISGSEDLLDQHQIGLLVPPSDPVALAAGIVYLLKNTSEAKNMAVNARSKIVNRYNIETIADEYIKLYRK